MLFTPKKAYGRGKLMFDRLVEFLRDWVGTFVLILLGVFVVFCVIAFHGKTPQSFEKSSNPLFNVEFLFEKDGVKVYRFDDAGRPIYYIDARGSTQWTEFNGKTSQPFTLLGSLETHSLHAHVMDSCVILWLPLYSKVVKSISELRFNYLLMVYMVHNSFMS